jgi:ATP-dependent Clp protease protease subunit
MIIKTNAPANIIEYPEDSPARFSRPKYITIQEFDESTASRFTEGFNFLLNEPQSVIPIYISSPGGAIFSLMGIRDLVACSPKPVLTFTASMAASCGALLLALGTKGYRYASPNAMILVHEASTASEGKTSEIINEALYIEKLNNELLELLAENSNKSKEFYKKLIKKNNNADLFISPVQAKEWGIIDHIAVPKIEMNVKVDYAVIPTYPNKVEKIKKSN